MDCEGEDVCGGAPALWDGEVNEVMNGEGKVASCVAIDTKTWGYYKSLDYHKSISIMAESEM